MHVGLIIIKVGENIKELIGEQPGEDWKEWYKGQWNKSFNRGGEIKYVAHAIINFMARIMESLKKI